MNIVTKIRFHLCLIKHLFSGLHKWGIANDPATEDERFTETCFEERFGRRRQSQPKTSAPSVISGAIKQLVKIRVNLWLFNTRYAIRNTSNRPLHLSRTLYKSTLFMQNKPNLLDAQMNVSNIITRNYQNFIPLAGYKNKPNSNPIKPNLVRRRRIANVYVTKDYRKKDDFVVRINKPNFVKGQK